MTNFWQALDSVDQLPNRVDVEYRLYYNDLGEPLFYSTEQETGNYIIIDKETYAVGRYDVQIVNKELVYPSQYVYKKLVYSNLGIETTVNDISIIGPGRIWNIKYCE